MLELNLREPTRPFVEKLGRAFSFLTPNAWTTLTLLFGLAAAYLIYSGHVVAAFAMLFFSGFCDLVDGAVARVSRRETKFGAFYDSTVDKVTESAIYFALALADTRLYFGALFALAAFMLASYVSQRGGAVGVKTSGGVMQRKERFALLVVGLLAMRFYNDALGGGVVLMSWILLLIGAFTLVTAVQRFWRVYETVK
jgi:archaetidylinositol phosphate synthase